MRTGHLDLTQLTAAPVGQATHWRAISGLTGRMNTLQSSDSEAAKQRSELQEATLSSSRRLKQIRQGSLSSADVYAAALVFCGSVVCCIVNCKRSRSSKRVQLVPQTSHARLLMLSAKQPKDGAPHSGAHNVALAMESSHLRRHISKGGDAGIPQGEFSSTAVSFALCVIL
ncbi:hypothetical protein WJX73_010047 [Symbiochloris irregularis]|uniref:Uncharacterized protein n=1 Tax=Symbiochloris irregularis TaxID=706552 RepID=A0AAW1NQZ7_9CHLO